VQYGDNANAYKILSETHTEDLFVDGMMMMMMIIIIIIIIHFNICKETGVQLDKKTLV